MITRANRPFVRELLGLIAGLLLAVAPGTASSAGGAAELNPWNQTRTPALDFENMDGTHFDPAGLRGKKVVVNFWAVWCAPCREEIPALERLAESMQREGVEILLVNVGDSRTAIERFLAKVPVKLRVLRTRGESVNAGAWQVSVLPTTVLIDGAGRARWVIRGAIDAAGEPLRAKIVAVPRVK